MKDRLLNFLLAFAVFLLVFNFFLPQPQKTAPVTGVAVSVASSSFTVPTIPTVTVTNATASGIAFDACKDFEILKDYRKIEIDGPFVSFCKTVEIPAGAKADLDFTPIARLFETPGKYAFKLKYAGTESVADTALEERGAIRTMLTEMFYRPVLNLFVFLIQNLPGHSL